MSRKTEFKADLQRIGYQLGRSHGTREARSKTFNTFARVMRELNYGIYSAAQIGGKLLQAFVRHRLESGIAARTVANEMTHVRAVLKHVGNQGLVRNPAYSNRSLGIPQGSRIGTKQPLSDAQIRAFQERMERWADRTSAHFWSYSERSHFGQWKPFAPARQTRYIACTASWRRADARACSTGPRMDDRGRCILRT